MVDLLSTVAPPDLREQIAELERELAQRAVVYPKLCAKGTLKRHRADYQVACIQAAIATLKKGDAVLREIKEIAAEYRRQADSGFVDTPGGLEHMGDVWKLLHRWDEALQ